MLHTCAFNNDSTEFPTQLSSVTSYYTSPPISNQDISPSNDRRNPFQLHCGEQQIIPPWTSFIPLPSPPDEEQHAGASEYVWSNGSLLSPQSPFDMKSPITKFSEEYCSLFPLPPSQCSDQNDEIDVLPGSSSHMSECLRSPAFASNNFSDRDTYMHASDQEETLSQASESESTHQKSKGRLLEEVRVVHNQVEQRYRHRVRDNINALWSVVPDAATSVQPSKAVVLKLAREHILGLQQRVQRAAREGEALQAKVHMLEQLLSGRPHTKGLKIQNVKYTIA